MASRALWKGQLRLSLVSIPVEIHSARNSERETTFRQIHRPTGKPVHYQKIVAGVGPIDSADIMKGYQTESGDYILLDPGEVDEVRLETRRTLELVQFVEASEIAPLWFDRPYYVVPTDELAEDAYRVVRDALRKTNRLGLGQLAMRGKEYLCAVRPCGDGLLMETLHYADEIRKADPLFASIGDDKVDKELLDIAEQLIARKTAPFDPTAFRDHYADALRELIARKQKSKKTPRAAGAGKDEAPAGSNVVDLMDALKKSLKTTRAPAGSGRKKAS